MPPRNRDDLKNFFPNTPTTSNNQPCLFFGGCELEEPLGEQPDIFEEPTGEEEEEEFCDFLEVSHQFCLKTGCFRKTYTMY